MSGLGGSVNIGHQHSCCSLASLSAVTAVSFARPSLPAEQQQHCMRCVWLCGVLSCWHTLAAMDHIQSASHRAGSSGIGATPSMMPITPVKQITTC